LVFGTIDNPPRKPVNEEQKKLSDILRKAWTDFAKDPVNGLNKLGWPMYQEDSKSDNSFVQINDADQHPLLEPTVIRIGAKDSSAIKFELRADDCSAS
jgi:carboxylesterase type B